ncbi:hypothetical protein BGZ65_012828 [Modicella reniformis]|uniref:Crinkler effector protein N-terminal domain-containing protein n=1 Tax=Modicella reniformis TaxID=1440133 RepID=A0A9P6MAD2_9FUNG|nr:hypothetical protein BGZ65_012828 [Modicella reniformis]
MTDNPLTLFCLAEGETTSFPVEVDPTKTVDHLKELIKTKKSPEFDDFAADKLTLWRVSLPVVPKKDRKAISLADVLMKEELDETDDISDVFEEKPPKKTIHIIVQRPLPDVRARLVPGYLSDSSRPSTPLSGDLHADIKSITDKFFAPGPAADFLDAFVRGDRKLPVTEGSIRGLPRAWRRALGHPPKTRPSLLFLDLPDPLTPDSVSRNLAASSILEVVKENSRPMIPVFGVSGCGKTRAVIELLSQHWGFYFNASSDDWGSDDMITLHSTVKKYLNEIRETPTITRQVNNAYARKLTLLLFLSRLLIFKHCLGAPGSSETFTSARWTLLQACPHVLFKDDIFDTLFIQVLKLRHHLESDVLDLVRSVHEDTKGCLIKQGCLPKIKDDTRLLAVLDEAQFLGDAFNGSFQSMSSSDESPRPLLSPILHAFRDISGHRLTLVTCGTGLSINTVFWVQSSGSGLKDSSTTLEYLEFPGWACKDSIKSYISRVQMCLQDERSKLALDEQLPQDAVDMLFEKFAGRFRPAISALERIVEGNEPGAWKKTIEDVEDRLVSWAYRHIKGNLCYEISRLHDKHNKYKDQFVESIDNMLGLLMYQRCMFGNHDLVLKEVDPLLVEHAFGRIKIIRGRAVTVMDEPFVSKAVENYFVANDPYFKKEVRRRMVKSTAVEQGWKLLAGLEQGTTHVMMSMEEFMDSHVNHGSMRNNMPVAPFFFPKSKPSGPDLVFFIRIDGKRIIPVFVQMKLHQGSSNFSEKDWNDALSTVSSAKIEGHAKNFRKYCPNNVYISMIVAYPTKWTDNLPASSELPKDPSGVQQVIINVSDDNFGDIFPQEHVEFIDRLKNARKRTIDDDDSNNEDGTKKQKS